MRLMKVGLAEANATPMRIVAKHLGYSDIENQVKLLKQQQANV